MSHNPRLMLSLSPCTKVRVTTSYLYEAHKLVGEYDENGDVIQEYLYHNNTLIAIMEATETYKIFADHLDTSCRVANSEDTILWS